ncbi:hypothetical protein DM860_015964 [Cuscuta australis]|uniref:Peptidase C1A papain C-terminal domain-containing protein n=1 Tax=Cuscuta australis TaxID=267555 RepID=A0A328DYR6_9ASTE|nr:hypothetical protein DM860_015964 [Cuscuta australis]
MDTYLSNNCSGLPAPPPLRCPRRRGIRRTHSPKQDGGPVHNVSLDYIPAEIDWVKLGALTSVKNQGTCGCCWAFATVAALEGLNKIHYKTLLDLSEQHLLDCDTKSHGCNGGGIDRAFEYAVGNEGIAKEEDYPFVGYQGRCHEDEVEPYGSIESYKMVPKNDAWALQRAVALQPVAAAITYGPDYVPEFKNYFGGIYHPGKGGYCGYGTRHAVAVVGYHTNPNYWIIKNSWGTVWGEDGYMRLARDPSIIGPCGKGLRTTTVDICRRSGGLKCTVVVYGRLWWWWRVVVDVDGGGGGRWWWWRWMVAVVVDDDGDGR